LVIDNFFFLVDTFIMFLHIAISIFKIKEIIKHPNHLLVVIV